jgi:hypothetical protein
MNTDLNILFEFLEQAGADVAGRESSEPDDHIVHLLQRFSRGECDPLERADVCRMIRLHPAWLRWIATRVKLSRDLQHEGEHAVAT